MEEYLSTHGNTKILITSDTFTLRASQYIKYIFHSYGKHIHVEIADILIFIFFFIQAGLKSTRFVVSLIRKE